jgi:hypothetical protein
MSEKKQHRSGHSITAADMIHKNSGQRLCSADIHHILKNRPATRCHTGTTTTLKLLLYSQDYQQSVITFCSSDIMARTCTNIKVCCKWKQGKADTCNTISTSRWSLHQLQNCPFLPVGWISTMWLTSHVQAGVAERLITGLTFASQGEELHDFTITANTQIIMYNPPTQSRPFILLHTV